MRMEIKVCILSLLFSFICCAFFTYFLEKYQNKYYVLQVGIYEKEENKNVKLEELDTRGIEGDFYNKDNKYYVYAFYTNDKKEIENYQKENDIKGIIKSYYCSFQIEKDHFIKMLKAGEI